MKVLVTGATGVYGRSVVERLVRNGHEVVAVARRPPKALPAGVRFAAADVRDLEALTRAMDGCDVVCHLAFVVTPIHDREESRRISVGGTENVLEAIRRTGVRRLVSASSAMTYGANPDNPPLFTEQHEQRPAPDYVYGTDKVAAERTIIASGIEAVMARTAVTVGRNIDNLLVDIFAAPAIVGIKGVDIRYQLVHQDDIGRFFAHACETGPVGPVNVSPPDFLPLEEIARILNKRYVEVSAEQALKGVEFMWKHDLADITPGEAAGISYLPRMATDRLRDEWGFECAWSTADAVLDLRRAVTGLVSVAKRRVDLPWRLRFPTQRPGDVVLDGESGEALGLTGPTGEPVAPGELDTTVRSAHPVYARLDGADAPLSALTLGVHAQTLRSAVSGVLRALGEEEDSALALSAVAVGSFGHRLYINDDVLSRVTAGGGHRRVLERAYAGEVARLSRWAGDTLARADDLAGQSDARLEATAGLLRDDLAWFWSIAGIGATLDGDALTCLGELVIDLPGGAVAATSAPARPARAQAERTAIALGEQLAAVVAERARRLIAAGRLDQVGDAAHLSWDELLADSGADLRAVVTRRRAEHERLRAIHVPRTVAAIPPGGAIATSTQELQPA